MGKPLRQKASGKGIQRRGDKIFSMGIGRKDMDWNKLAKVMQYSSYTQNSILELFTAYFKTYHCKKKHLNFLCQWPNLSRRDILEGCKVCPDQCLGNWLSLLNDGTTITITILHI
jgi:hypothetical protein